mmetsp:Transcript_8234/g.28892  ORF Transcript_8234/g.28892 Transcript_8234/m.28892 type:complete len:459 (-) Transcript_8234:409-1785(-)
MNIREEFGDAFRCFALFFSAVKYKFFFELVSNYQKNTSAQYSTQRKIYCQQDMQGFSLTSEGCAMQGIVEYGVSWSTDHVVLRKVSTPAYKFHAHRTDTHATYLQPWIPAVQKPANMQFQNLSKDPSKQMEVEQASLLNLVSNCSATKIVGLRSQEFEAAEREYLVNNEGMVCLSNQCSALKRKLDLIKDDLLVVVQELDKQRKVKISLIKQCDVKKKECEVRKMRTPALDDAFANFHNVSADKLCCCAEYVRKYQRLKQKTQIFKHACRESNGDLQSQLHTITERTNLDSIFKTYSSQATKKKIGARALRHQACKIAFLKYRLGTTPTHSELLQFEQRFSELYENVQRNLDSTRMCYVSFNVMTDMKSYITKETSLLNSMSQHVASYGAYAIELSTLVASLQQALQDVRKSLQQVCTKLNTEHAVLQSANKRYSVLVQQLRMYCRTAKQLEDTMADS